MADHTASLAIERPVLEVYYRALSGRVAHLLGAESDADPARRPDTPTTIRLPNRIGHFSDARGNLDWYKVALTHRAGHDVCGSFGFRLDAPSRFSPRLTDDVRDVPASEPETDLERVLRCVTYRSLAVDLFTVAEDLRIDAALPRMYPGVARALARVQAAELAGRPSPAVLSPRAGLLELFVRISLGAWELPALPALLHRPARQLRTASTELRHPDATVQDAVELALRAYALITRLPPLTADYGPAVPVDETPGPCNDWRIRLPEPDPVRLEGDAILDTAVAPVGYRDLLGWRYARYHTPPPPGQDAIFSIRAVTGSDDDSQPAAPDTDAEPRPAKPPEPLPHEHHEWHVDHYHRPHGELAVEAAGDHLYPEWDHVRSHYRPRWCRVRERTLPPGPSARLYEETVRAHRDLLPGLVRHLERLAPEGRRLVGRRPDGDDLDLDASIDAIVDVRTGVSAGDNVHQRRERVRRDVAVAFLLDLSSSTAERVGSETADPRRVARVHGRPYRRIIDLERESVAVLLAALQRTGDAVGVYGFSGTGRGDVRFDLVKDLGEPVSRRVASRIEALRPVHTTRMGPAVRHATAKLRAWQAATRLLVLVSDGRPYDRDYGQEYGEGAELDYAVQDTRQALQEAQGCGVRPFVLTVDTEGHDYLRQLGGDADTELLTDVTSLPVHLLSLYRRLSR